VSRSALEPRATEKRPRDPQRFAPVIVLSPARSHSSVVTAMIGSHPELYGFPELILFDRPTLGERMDAGPLIGKRPRGWNPVAGLERAVAELHYGAQGSGEIAAARRWLERRRAWPGADVMDHLLRLVAPRTGVEKSPDTVNGEDRLARALAAYPRARFIHLVRHPVTAQRSMQRRLFLFDRPVPCALGWLNQHRRILEFRARLPAAQSLLVRTEFVLNHPRDELARIARWLGIAADAVALDAMCHPERSPYANAGHDGARGGNDPVFLHDPTPHAVELPPSLEHPEEWKLPEDLERDIIALAEQLGYGRGSSSRPVADRRRQETRASRSTWSTDPGGAARATAASGTEIDV
jgi:hypothetical protein